MAEQLWDRTDENILDRLSDSENHPHESLAPYEEFRVGANTYYFTPGGFRYRKDPGAEEVGDFFCGYLAEEVGTAGPTTDKTLCRSLGRTGAPTIL